MKTRGFPSIGQRFFALLILLCSPLATHAQLVADGQAAVLDAVGTNIADNVTVGTNGSFTLLMVTNGAMVTNSGTVSVGLNASASHNRVILAGGSSWENGGISFNIGNSGSFNELDILGGSLVTNIYGYIGYSSPSSNNTVVVSDPGSLWRSTDVYLGQSGGANNLLIITNGATVASAQAILGTGFGAKNTAVVTGAGSVWTNGGGLSVGAYGSNSLFIVTNGGVVLSGSGSGIGMLGASSVGNLAVVTDAGSKWSSTGKFSVGDSSSRNELDILNGGVVADVNALIGNGSGLSNNLAVVAGAGSVWTNTSLAVGNSSPRNSLVITNGGKVWTSSTSFVSQSPQASNNAVLISGANSVWNSGYLYLGNSSPGNNRLTINNGGALISSSVFDEGVYCNSNLLTLADAGSLLQCQTLRVGYSSTGNQCVVSNGATLAVPGNQASVVEGTFTRVTITGASTLWTNAADLQFGQDSNVLAILNGALLVNGNGTIETGSGFPDGKPNAVVVAGAGSFWNNRADLRMLVENNAQLLITNGGVVADNYAYIDDFPTSAYGISPGLNCYVLVSGPGSLWTNRFDVFIGNKGGANLLVVADSGTVSAHNLFFGNALDGNQMVVSNSGAVLIRNELQIGFVNSKSNSVVVSGGSIGVTNTLSLNNFATLTLNSGVLRAGFLSIFGTTNQFNFNGGLLQLANSHRFDSSPLVVGDGIDAATFDMLLNGAHTFPGGLIVAGNGLLKGSGTITGNLSVNNGGTLAPGETAMGVIAVHGNVALNPGSKTYLKLNALTLAADSLIGITNLTYGGTLQLTNTAGALAAGNAFKLFAATNYLGAFDNLLPATPGAGLRWDTNELNVDGVLRVFSTTTPAPLLASATAAGGNLTLNASGGIPYDPCYLMTCTNFPPAPVDWTCIATNFFDSTGATGFTNAIPPGEPQRYFRLQVN
jgi:T5SS/PEP-CTERM-associated repeat protein